MDPLTMLFAFSGCFASFCAVDRLMTVADIQSPYYAIHAAHNIYIVFSTFGDVVSSLTDFGNIQYYDPNYKAAAAVAALHFYHMVLYRTKLRFDDWLHHILMILVALPIGVFTKSSTLLGYSLFFSTGLPGGIDYLLLFLNRNGLMQKSLEKRVNRWLNVWIRSPGCISHATLNVLYACMYAASATESWTFYLTLVPAALMFWNGQYFMQQVVADEERSRLESRTLHYE